MNGMSSNDDSVECPLCMEPLEVDDLTFFPCTCGYQICRFCWHRIRTDENKLCPACRKEYPENPADFKPLSQEEMIAFKSQKRQRDQQRKHKITENRKHLANVRVVQRNLVFVVGLPPRLADADILKKHEYFGKYGKIHKVVINPSTTYAGVQVTSNGPSASAYVTYVHNADALRAIQSVNNIMIDGRLIKTSLGTTKYCSHFMKNQQCPKGDCMYLHELGDPEASFTKEQMHQGKHQEYEKRLHDALTASFGQNSPGAANCNGTPKTNASTTTASSATTSSSSVSAAASVASSAVNVQQKEAWPSLSVSPVNGKEPTASTNTNGKNKKDKFRNEKTRHEKVKSKNNKNSASSTSNTSNKENFIPDARDIETITTTSAETIISTKTNSSNSSNLSRTERNKDKESYHDPISSEQKENKQNVKVSQTKTEVECVKDKDNSIKLKKRESCETTSQQTRSDSSVQRSLSSCSENSEGHVSESSVSVKSLPVDYQESKCNITRSEDNMENVESINTTKESMNADCKTVSDCTSVVNESINSVVNSTNNNGLHLPQSPLNPPENGIPLSDELSKLNIFDDTISFFSSSAAFQQAPILKNKIEVEMRQSHLPDLINDIDGIQKASNTNEWEDAFKNVMLRNNKQVEEQLLQQQNIHQHQQHFHQQALQQQEEFLRMHELQKRNDMANNIALTQVNAPFADILSHFRGNSVDINRVQALQHQMQQNAGENGITPNNAFGGNMSKFFDFHKSQQQSHQYPYGHTSQINGNLDVNDTQRATSLLENTRLNAPYVETGPNTKSHIQKQRLIGMFETLSQPPNSQSQLNRFPQSTIIDDDLGFDPFIETQKGLAELMENEVVQQQSINNGNSALKLQQQAQTSHQQRLDNIQRARMPPPGFNHMNSLGFGGASRLHSSKMMPFLSSSLVKNGTQAQQHQVPQATNWNANLPAMHPSQGQHIGDAQLQHQIAQNKVYSSPDWTAMDPAILSFRQFSSFPQNQMPPHPQQQQDIFLQHLVQQPNSQGFNTQPQQLLSGMPMPNNILNGQQLTQPQVNANVQGMLEFLKSRQFV
ncbi:transcription factor SPT20 homolog [Drosophila madeirensis]|uniref:CCR4-NOT transcription complex subunit 4 n=1 Tax=Drosophila madeirensis TaxID=30013 RepID=A0AAU9FH26_DROMD